MLFKNYWGSFACWRTWAYLYLIFIKVKELQIVLRATETLDVLIFFKEKFCLMSSLKFTLSDVTSFLPDNLSEPTKIILRPEGIFLLDLIGFQITSGYLSGDRLKLISFRRASEWRCYYAIFGLLKLFFNECWLFLITIFKKLYYWIQNIWNRL